jgi:putative DNA primase/helicase
MSPVVYGTNLLHCTIGHQARAAMGQSETPNHYRASDPLDYNTKITAVCAAPPGTEAPLWLAFLETVTDNNAELIGFLQRFLGYCLTGFVHEHVLVFLYGTGRNGKGTFVNTVADIMGDYAIVAPIDMFLLSKYDRHPTEIARLKGVRLVTAQETQKGRAWDEAKIKNLTGGDKLTGHFMRADYFDFFPTHKFLFSGNHKPSLRNVDEAIRARILLVPFTVRIPEKERDLKLGKKLEQEWPAILRWMIDGYLEWQRIGLNVPKIVRDASAEYFSDQDTLRDWLEARTVAEHDQFTLSTALFGSWKQWCEIRNLPIGTVNALVEGLKERGFEKKNKEHGRGFIGIRLKSPSEMEI